jgi:DMSO/TMAO reductase YedYZ molybdopterin-dependent catalytic subunit
MDERIQGADARHDLTPVSRRAWIAAAIGIPGAAAIARMAQRYGFIPPDHGGAFGIGETLNYATHRLTSHVRAREFSRNQISKQPFANEMAPPSAEFRRLQAGGFAEWRLAVDGLVDRPISLSVAQLKGEASRSQITHMACEEGWSYIAEWTGVPLARVLEMAGVRSQAKYLVYFSIEKDWWDSIDLEEARHPQTLLAYGMNGGELPVANGGPLRIRVPRQLGYKNVKFVNRLTLTDDLTKFGKGLGSVSPEQGYAWYAGI